MNDQNTSARRAIYLASIPPQSKAQLFNDMLAAAPEQILAIVDMVVPTTALKDARELLYSGHTREAIELYASKTGVSMDQAAALADRGFPLIDYASPPLSVEVPADLAP